MKLIYSFCVVTLLLLSSCTNEVDDVVQTTNYMESKEYQDFLEADDALKIFIKNTPSRIREARLSGTMPSTAPGSVDSPEITERAAFTDSMYPGAEELKKHLAKRTAALKVLRAKYPEFKLIESATLSNATTPKQ